MTDASKASAGRRRRGKAVLALISVVVSLLAAEGAVRIVKRGVPFQPDPDLIRSLRPNVEAPVLSFELDDNLEGRPVPVPARPFLAGYNRTNNIGFRMADDVGPKAPDERRVLVLGDSFTEGDQVPGDRRFTYLADQRLKAATAAGPERWRLLNGAIQNGSPVQYVLQLRRWLDAVKPDVVIVDLAPNDATDDAGFEAQYGFTFDAEGRPLAPRARTTLGLLQASYLLRYFNIALLRSPRATGFFFPWVSPEISVPQTVDLFCRAEPGARAVFDQKTARYLKQIKAMVEAKGARFGVFMIQYMWVFDDEPFHEPLYPGLRAQLDGAGCLTSHGRPYDAFVEAFLRDAGIAFANPHEALLRAKKESPKRKLWNYVDYHFSPAGHRLISEEMSAFVERLRAAR